MGVLLSCLTGEETEAQEVESLAQSWHQHAQLSAVWAPTSRALEGPGGWGPGAGCRALTNVHGVGVGERLGRQDGVLQSFLIIGGWRLIVGVIFHRRLVLLVGGLIVTVILHILIVIGTLVVIFFLDIVTGTVQAAGAPQHSACLCLLSPQASQWSSRGDRQHRDGYSHFTAESTEVGEDSVTGQQGVALGPPSRSSGREGRAFFSTLFCPTETSRRNEEGSRMEGVLSKQFLLQASPRGRLNAWSICDAPSSLSILFIDGGCRAQKKCLLITTQCSAAGHANG